MHVIFKLNSNNIVISSVFLNVWFLLHDMEGTYWFGCSTKLQRLGTLKLEHCMENFNSNGMEIVTSWVLSFIDANF